MLDLLKFDIGARNRASPVLGDVKNELRGIRGALAGVNDHAKRTGRSIRNMGAGLSVGVTAPIVMIGRQALNAAKDTQEAQSMFDQVFKGAAADTRNWSRSLAQEIGRSSYDLQNQAAEFQQILGKMAPDNDSAARMSRTLTGLSQDLSSFFNTTESDAAAKLRAGLIGEAEPLRQFGILISAAAVEQQALAMGLAATKKELTEQDKVLARYQLILDQTADAQGDAARTSGSLTNKQRALDAAHRDLLITMGLHLIPIMTKVTTALVDVVNWFGSLTPEARKTTVAVAGFAAAAGPVAMGLGALAIGFSTLATPLGLAVFGFAAVAGATAYVVTKWDDLVARFPILQRAADFGATIKEKWSNLPAIKWALLIPAVRWLKFVPMLSWLRFIPKVPWVGLVGKLSWGLLVKPLIWTARLIPGIGWLAMAGALAWSLVVKPLIWDPYLSKIDWGRWIPKVDWSKFVDPTKDARAAAKAQAEAIGKYVGDGVALGVSKAGPDGETAVRSYMKNLEDTAKDEAGIKSPSRVFMRIGEFLMQGLAVGVQNTGGEAVQETRNAMTQIISEADGASSYLGTFRSSARSAFTTLLTDAKNFKSNFGSILSGWGNSLLNSAAGSLFDLIWPMAKGGVVSGGRVQPYANGGAFDGGRALAFASGGVVDRPTFFPMRGKTGLMGEAGPEAILPLARGPGGKLGVRAQGGGGGGAVGVTLHFAPVIDARGADQAAVARIGAELQALKSNFSEQVARTVSQGRMRRNPAFGG